MSSPTPTTKELARRLIALEATRHSADGPSATLRASELLRGPLAKFVGVAGYRSLMSRALVIAMTEIPSLGSVQVRPDGSLEGLDGVEPKQDADTGVEIVSQLLGLLVTFIGEPLMRRLVHDVWLDATEAETDRIEKGLS